MPSTPMPSICWIAIDIRRVISAVHNIDHKKNFLWINYPNVENPVINPHPITDGNNLMHKHTKKKSKAIYKPWYL